MTTSLRPVFQLDTYFSSLFLFVSGDQNYAVCEWVDVKAAACSQALSVIFSYWLKTVSLLEASRLWNQAHASLRFDFLRFHCVSAKNIVQDKVGSTGQRRKAAGGKISIAQLWVARCAKWSVENIAPVNIMLSSSQLWIWLLLFLSCIFPWPKVSIERKNKAMILSRKCIPIHLYRYHWQLY